MPAELLMPRRRSWSMWIAVRSLLTGITALIVAFVLQGTALPRLSAEARDLPARQSRPLALLMNNTRFLPVVPVPAIVLGFVAVASRTARPALAPLAAIAAILALLAVVGALIGAMLPLYQAPPELELLR